MTFQAKLKHAKNVISCAKFYFSRKEKVKFGNNYFVKKYHHFKTKNYKNISMKTLFSLFDPDVLTFGWDNGATGGVEGGSISTHNII